MSTINYKSDYELEYTNDYYYDSRETKPIPELVSYVNPTGQKATRYPIDAMNNTTKREKAKPESRLNHALHETTTTI